MTTTANEVQTVQVYQLFIKASADAVWEAITKPEFTRRYFYGMRIETTPDRRRVFAADDDWGDDEVIAFDPPRKLVHGWRAKWNDEFRAEPESRVTWELEPQDDGTTLLTLVHDRLEHSPKTAMAVSGPGWTRVLSGLKTLLETGNPLIDYGNAEEG
jgi:uncharacterized protein YndB with AHSA1/START domain